MTDRTVLITGANKSIGYETARQLGQQGFRIWLGSRDADRGGAAAENLAAEGINVRALTLDVTTACDPRLPASKGTTASSTF